jgi:hypothetical protein
MDSQREREREREEWIRIAIINIMIRAGDVG